MEDAEIVDWLLEEGGASVHFRTLVDLVRHNDMLKVSCALDDLINSPLVKLWLSRLGEGLSFKSLHSGRPDAFENTVGKLVQLGMRAGLQPFDNLTLKYRAWLTDNLSGNERRVGPFKRLILASFLSYAGYHDTTTVNGLLQCRLNTVHRFATQGDLSNIYASPERQRQVPGSYSSHRLIRAGLRGKHGLALPYVHDLLGFGSSQQLLRNPVQRVKLGQILDMIMSDEYQSLPRDYGVMETAGIYRVIGWSIHLPELVAERGAEMLMMMELLAPFERGRESVWFKDAWHILEMQKTERDTYRFPTHWLRDQPSGYWINGAYMALGRRRTNPIIEQESTFRVLWLKHLMTR